MPEYTYILTQRTEYYGGVEFDSPTELIEAIQSGEQPPDHHSQVLGDDRIEVYENGTLVADTDAPDSADEHAGAQQEEAMTTIPPAPQTNGSLRHVRKPPMPFRILPSDNDWDTQYFLTQQERDDAGRALAQQHGKDVLLEFWDWTNSQDPVNQGWALDHVIQS